ncbi:MAG: D-alanine--D-alanine ligase [Lachnospira sp.]|nr:D-alanine--D-alanine ligase [Lachnospira sp.]
MNIVVLAGGTSTERDISLLTSTKVCESLRRNGHHANMIDVFLGTEEYADAESFFLDQNDLEELGAKLAEQSKNIAKLEKERNAKSEGFFGTKVLEFCKAADIVFMGLHGANGEDGKIQAAFDLMGIKYTGTGYLSSAISMDKELTKKVLIAEGIPMPKGVCLKKGHKIEYAPLPCVVKPCCGGSSVGVYIANTEDEFNQAVKDAFEYEDHILVEEYVKGREFSVAVVNGRALPVVEIVPHDGFYDYENKYKDGASDHICPANIPEELSDQMKRWAEKACEAAEVYPYGRVDELVNEDGEIYCLEINTLPGMTPNSLIPLEAAAEGMSYDELTQHLIDISMEKYI